MQRVRVLAENTSSVLTLGSDNSQSLVTPASKGSRVLFWTPQPLYSCVLTHTQTNRYTYLKTEIRIECKIKIEKLWGARLTPYFLRDPDERTKGTLVLVLAQEYPRLAGLVLEPVPQRSQCCGFWGPYSSLWPVAVSP